MASIPGLEHLEEHGWEIVGFDNVSQEEYCVGDGGRIERWICNSPSPTKRLIIRKVQHPKPAKQCWTPMFGDVVTLKRDSSNPKELIVRSNKNTVLILCVSENERRVVWANFADLVFVRRPVPASFWPETVQAIAKAVADELRGSWADRMVEPAKRQTLDDSLVGVWVPPKQAEAPWTPKVGDWVKVTKPVDCAPAHKIWWVQDMDQFDGKVMQVTSVNAHSPCATLDKRAYDFDFAWLALAEDPRGQPATKHREPTRADLANGPIECEVRNHNTELWMAGKLLQIHMGFGFSSRFECRVGMLQKYWHQCRIEVK